MEATLQALGAILLKAVPTLLLLILVHLYLKWMFFGPLRDVLRKRWEATGGARTAAEVAVSKANDKAGEIDAALRQAREEIYQELEETRKRLITEQTGRIDEARKQSHALVHQARDQVAADTDAAKRELAGTVESLAGQIAHSLLDRRTA